VAAWYLGSVTGLTIVAKVASIEHLDRVARWLVPRSLRPLIGLAVGAGVVTAAASMTVPRDAPPTRLATVTLEAPTDATATMYFVTEPVAVSTTLALAPTTSAPVTTLSPAPTFTPIALQEHAPTVAPTLAAPPTWTIAPGEHLWAVARETLADSWHRAPTDAEVTPYWRALIEINRSRLIDSTNADYVLAGQIFVLPDVPTAPGK
jgi:hypothetical protein